jgi:hypothetical protein
MHDLSKFKRVADDDPKRCNAVAGINQCHYEAIENSKFCAMHAGFGHSGRTKEDQAKQFNYNLHKYRARVIDFAENPQVKSLREEVGVLRLLLEETLNKCHDTTELMIYSNKISDLVLKIERLVSSCHNLEAKTGQLLDKTVVLKLAENLVRILNGYIDDIDLLDQLSKDITTMLSEQFTDPLTENSYARHN